MNALRRKKKRLEKKLMTAHTMASQVKFDRELSLIHYEIKEAFIEFKGKHEQYIVGKIKSNPRVFFGYARSHSKIRNEITVLRNHEGNFITGVRDIGNILQEQFSSVYSNPDSEDIEEPDFPVTISHQFSPELFTISRADIKSAIKDLKTISSPGPDGFPSQLLKACCDSLSNPLSILWKQSFDLQTVPKYYKLSFVHPLHKKCDRISPQNYRPISLTSHIMKVAERRVKSLMIDHLESNNISNAQHGFRTGRNTLTQLLAHFEQISDNLSKGIDTDSIYLNYAKAFNSVDQKLLGKKIRM